MPLVVYRCTNSIQRLDSPGGSTLCWIILTSGFSWGNVTWFLLYTKEHVIQAQKNQQILCVLQIYREIASCSAWRKYHFTNPNEACSQEYVLSCLCRIPPPSSEVCSLYKFQTFFYKSSVHLNSPVIWLQVINTILLSSKGGKLREYSARHCRSATDLKRGGCGIALFILSEGTCRSPLCMHVSCFTKAGTQLFPSVAQGQLYFVYFVL